MENKREFPDVNALLSSLRHNRHSQIDEGGLFADLTGLFSEIISEISLKDKDKVTAIYDYAKLLERENQLYSAEDAYIAGKESSNLSESKILLDYLNKVYDRQLAERIQDCFDEIAALLDHNAGLLADFTYTYNEIYTVVKDNIFRFIRLGKSNGAVLPL